MLRAIRVLGCAALVPALLACTAPLRRAARDLPVSDPASLRTTTEGPVIGVSGPDANHAWLGIPYAASPVGELRWKSPRAPERRTELLQAVRAGSPCPQLASPIGVAGRPGSVVGNEDCLTLNVFAPRLSAADVPTGEERLPVMLWIHGGGNSVGTGSMFPGGRLASTQGVILVTINYRLGPLGWFRHPALRADAADAVEASGNFGTLDILRALDWVRDNAAAFGGDPERITLFGESAGGVNVYTLLASPLAKGKFQRAIVQSGGTLAVEAARAENLRDAQPPGATGSTGEVLLELLVKKGRASDRESALAAMAAMTPAEIAALLRSTTPTELILAYKPSVGGMLDMPLVFRDGHVLPERKLDEYLASAEGHPRIPVLFGTNRDEMRGFQLADPKMVRYLLGLFPRARDPEVYVRSARYTSALWKATGADEIAASLVRAGNPDVFVYRFDWDEQPRSFTADLPLLVGASHGMEVPFVFGSFKGPVSFLFSQQTEQSRVALSDAMMSYWAQFAATGDPGRGRSGALPRWQRWDESSPNAPRFVVLDTEAGGGIRMVNQPVTRDAVVRDLAIDPTFGAREERCSFFESINYQGELFGPAQRTSAGCDTPGVASGQN